MPTFDPTDWSGCTLDLVAEDCDPMADPSPWASRVGSISLTASGASRPIAGDPMGGNPTLRFSGAQAMTSTDQLMEVFPDNTNWTVFVVVKMKGYTNAATFGAYVLGDPIFGDSGEYFAVQGTSTDGGQVCMANYNGGYFRTRRTLALNTSTVIGFRGSSATSKSQASIAGQGRVTAQFPPSTTSNVIQIAGLSLPLRVGGATTTGRFGNFELARIFAYGRALSDAEYDEVMAAVEAEYGLASQAWEPTTPAAPTWWHAVETGRIWQDTAGTIPAVTAGDPVARIDARAGSNFSQATGTLAPYLTTLGDGLGVRSDDVDDNLGNSSTLTAGAKTVACIFQTHSQPGSTGNETIVRLGATPQQIIVRHSGLSASSAKGWHFAIDRSSTSAVCIQPTGGPALLSNGIHSLVIRYDGSGTASAAAYRAWLDGVEVSLTTGGNVAASGNSRWLATSVPAEMCDASLRESVVWAEALSPEDCAAMASRLEAMRS